MRRMPQSYRNGELVIVIDCPDLAGPTRFRADVPGYLAGPGEQLAVPGPNPADDHGIEVLLQRTGDDVHHKNRASGTRAPPT